MQKVKQLNIRLDAMEGSHSVVGRSVVMTEQEDNAVGLRSAKPYLKISNPNTGATFYYPDNGRLQSAED